MDRPGFQIRFNPVPKPKTLPKASKKRFKQGKKVKVWDKARGELKVDFAKRGIRSCEIMLDGCLNKSMLSFAHIDKRNNLKKDEITAVVLACQSCHQAVEKLPAKRMREYLEQIINQRSL
jgi:hypothetical protein